MANELDIKRENKPQNRQQSSFELMPEFEDMVERFFGSRFSPLLGDWPTTSRRMSADIQETEKAYVLTAELPGVPKDEIDINVSGNLLTIRAEHKEESDKKDQGYRRSYRSFQESFALPTTVDPDKIEAHCENGVLEVLLPKTERSQAKRVEVQTGKGGFLNRIMGRSENKGSEKGAEKH